MFKWLILFGFFIFIVGGWASRDALTGLFQANNEVKRWILVEAHITQSYLDETYETTGSIRGMTISHEWVYRPVVNYTYNFEGKEYAGSKIKLLDLRGENKNKYQAIVDKYPLGKKVTVFVNPQQPSDACLERTVDYEGTIALAIFGGVFAIIGLGILITGIILVTRSPRE